MTDYVRELEARLHAAECLMQDLLDHHEAREFYDLGKFQAFLRTAWPDADSTADRESER